MCYLSDGETNLLKGFAEVFGLSLSRHTCFHLWHFVKNTVAVFKLTGYQQWFFFRHWFDKCSVHRSHSPVPSMLMQWTCAKKSIISMITTSMWMLRRRQPAKGKIYGN